MADLNEILARMGRAGVGSAPGETGNNPSLAGLPQLQALSPGAVNAFQGMASPPPPGLTNIGASSERAASDRTANLLNLLKFNQPAASDSGIVRSASAAATSTKAQQPSASGNPQEALLKLLNRPQHTASRSASTSAQVKQEASTGLDGQDTDVQQAASQTMPRAQAKTPIFTYVNPFDDLAASAPTNTTTKQSNYGSDGHASSKATTPLPDGRTQVEALLGIGSKPKESETVSAALQEVGQQAKEQASSAIERAEEGIAKAQEDDPNALEHAMQEPAVDIQAGLKDTDTKAEMERDMPPAMAKAFENTIEKIASGQDVADSWESAEAEESAVDARFYTFPMKPFVTLDLKSDAPSAPRVREDIVMKIASMKREFDQVDRTLAAATTNHIVYAMTKGGGVRVIRQDDGNNKHVFKKSGAPIYNIGVSLSEADQTESVLATAVNGSVYWTEIPFTTSDGFGDMTLEEQGFCLPPLPSQEENNTSGAQLKTRAKLSSRHPEFFALGRGKSIYFIWPKVAMWPEYCDQKTRIVDSEKYFAERSLKVATGKAGKDFAFSQDDSVLVSLDKAGRLKFWDIKDHTNPEIATPKSPAVRQVDVKVPLMVLETSQPEKSWATSVQFVDKDRPYSKGQALRYILVGSKQNHTITLWDLCLGKAVQELNFPHNNETDPICSINYHAKTSVVAVGHPTRNSIYLVQLSAPKYNLPNMSQAEFVERLNRQDTTLPRPQSTAIMSGMREISLDGLGSLRSLDINGPVLSEDPDERVLELYIMHSKGVTCLNMERQDIGIGKDGKPLNPVDGGEAKAVSWRDFEGPSQRAASSEASSAKAHESPVVKAEPTSASKPAGRVREVVAPPSKTTNGTAKAAASAPAVSAKPVVLPERPKESPATFASITRGSKAPDAEPDFPSYIHAPKAIAPKDGTARAAQTTAQAVPTERTVTPHRSSTPHQSYASTSQDFGATQISQLSQSISQAMGGVLSEVFTSVLSDQLSNLYRKFDEDKRVQEAAGSAKQDAVLRLVSSTLTDNVEKSLSLIVNNGIQQSVLPSVKTVVAQTLEKELASTLRPQIQNVVPKELKSALTPAVNQAMQDPEVLRIISDLVSSKIAGHVEHVFAATLRNSIAPAFQTLAIESARSMSGEIDARVRDQLRAFEMNSQNDTAKIDQMTGLTTELLHTVRNMAGAQAEMQTEMLKLRTELAQYQEQAAVAAADAAAASVGPSHKASSSQQVSQDPELDGIAELMSEGRHEEGTIKVSISFPQKQLETHH